MTRITEKTHSPSAKQGDEVRGRRSSASSAPTGTVKTQKSKNALPLTKPNGALAASDSRSTDVTLARREANHRLVWKKRPS